MSAAVKVFGTPELQEMILANVDFKTVLQSQTVCRAFVAGFPGGEKFNKTLFFNRPTLEECVKADEDKDDAIVFTEMPHQAVMLNANIFDIPKDLDLAYRNCGTLEVGIAPSVAFAMCAGDTGSWQNMYLSSEFAQPVPASNDDLDLYVRVSKVVGRAQQGYEVKAGERRSVPGIYSLAVLGTMGALMAAAERNMLEMRGAEFEWEDAEFEITGVPMPYRIYKKMCKLAAAQSTSMEPVLLWEDVECWDHGKFNAPSEDVIDAALQGYGL